MPALLYSIRRYTGTGAPQTLAVPPYLSKTHLTVTVEGVPTLAYTWPNAGSIQITAPAGAAVEIRRLTSPTERLTDYQGAVPLTEGDLDQDSIQAFYLAQEALDASTEGALPMAPGLGEAEGLTRGFEVSPEAFAQFGRSDHDMVAYALAAVAAVGGGRVRLARMYQLDSKTTVPNYCEILGPRDTGFTLNPLTFTNTDITAGGRYLPTSAALDCSGQTVSPFIPSEGIRLTGFTIRGNQIDGRMVDAVVAQNARDFVVQDLKIHNFSLGCGIRGSSLQGAWAFRHNHIHGFYENSPWLSTQNPQMTGIELDNDRVGGLGSVAGQIVHNTITDLICGPAFVASRGYESDGINLHNGCQRVVVQGNVIKGVGEGIDLFGGYNQILGNSLSECHLFSLKLIHGAFGNIVTGNLLAEYGLAGIVLSGSGTDNGDTKDNVFTGNHIKNGGFGNYVTVAMTPASIRLQDAGSPQLGWVRNNLFVGNHLVTNDKDKFAFLDACTGSGNVAFGNKVTVESAGTLTSRVSISSGASTWTSAARSVFRAGPATTLVLTTAVQTRIPLDTIAVDTQGEVSSATDRWTAKEDSVMDFVIKVRTPTTGAAGVAWDLELRKNGAAVDNFQTSAPGATDQSFSMVSLGHPAKAGDYFEAFVRQQSGADRNVTANIAFTSFSGAAR